jgi:hypothetical protein
MKYGKLFLSAAILAGGLAAGGAAFGAAVVYSEPLSANGDYCHLQFPAIEEDTLGTDHPALKSPDSGDLIDFYGPCDENPVGQNQVREQKLNIQRRYELENDD